MYTKIMKLMLTCAVLTGVFSMPVMAQVDGSDWLSKERFQIRARAIGILADGDGTVDPVSLKSDVSNAYVPEVDVTYFLTNNIAAELIAATAKHKIDAGSADVGSTWILPPTLTLQYHFMPDEKFSPYVGAGLNYSMFYAEDADKGFNSLEVEGGLGYAVQAGFDYWINDNWGANLDVKYVDLDVDVDVKAGATKLKADDVELNPFIVGAGVSYRF